MKASIKNNQLEILTSLKQEEVGSRAYRKVCD